MSEFEESDDVCSDCGAMKLEDVCDECGAIVMPRWLKWSLIALAAYFVFKEPLHAGQAFGAALGGLGHAADSAITFLTSVLPTGGKA